MAGPLATLWSDRRLLERRVWVLTAGLFVIALGRGVLLPFATLYFYNERGFPLATLGLALAIALPLGSLAGIVWGAVADRVGRKRIMLIGLAGMVAASIGLAFARTPAHYFAVIVLQAVAMGGWNPTVRAMVADITPPDRHARAFGILYLATNAGVSAGLLLGGLLALVLPYRGLFFIEAATALAYLVLVAALVPETARPRGPAEPGAWRAHLGALSDALVPLRDTRFVIFAFAGLLAGLGWGQFYLTYSPYLKNVLGASDGTIGAMLAINTVLVILLQLPVAAWVERKRRTRVYRYATYLLAWSMLLAWWAGRTGDLEAALVVMGLSIAIMTLGEVMIAPVGNALAAALGGPAHVGKYIAAFDLVWTLSIGAGGLVGGLAFDRGEPHLLWPLVSASVTLSLAAYWWLGRRLPSDVERPSSQGPHAPPSTRAPPPSGAGESAPAEPAP